MPEGEENAQATEAPPEEQGAPPEEAGAPEEVEETAPTGEEDLEIPEGDTFPRQYVEEVRDRYAKERVKRRDIEKQLEEYGGLDAVREAVGLQQAMQTEEGVIDLFIEAGRALGLGVREMEQLFGEGRAGGGGEGEEEEDDSRVLTLAEARRLLEEEVRGPLHAERMAEQEQAARKTVASTLKELGVDDQRAMQAVLQFGDRYLPQQYTTDDVAAAVRRGYEDWVSLMEEQGQKYRQKKAGQKQGVPKKPAGTSAGVPPYEPPKDLDEAFDRVRQKMLGRSG